MFRLTTNHPAAKCGRPVLVDHNGVGYQPDAEVCPGLTAAEIVGEMIAEGTIASDDPMAASFLATT